MWTFNICNDWNTISSPQYVAWWKNLLDTSLTSHVFYHPTLVKAWIETYSPLRNMTPFFISGVDADSGNEVFFPMIVWRRNWKHIWLKIALPVGFSDYDYHDPIFRVMPSDVGLFWNELVSLLKTYDFDKVIIDGIKEHLVYKDENWHRNEPCPYLNLSNIQNEDQLLMFFKSSLRGDIRRQIRRMNEIGEVSLKEYSFFDEAKITFQKFIQEHSLRWPHAYKAPYFHQNMLVEGLNSIVHFSSLNIGRVAVAWHLGFEYDGVYYYYMPAGDHSYSNLSPTKIHLYFLIRRAIEKGYKIFDHLRGEENYKQGFSNGLDYVNSLTINNQSLGSEIKNGIEKIISKLR
ncbi:GNAT family N-acetyltransferase [Alistipes sp. An116]|uniref:GNAT family N-acetyltransferase n=1 Tax=Alistipes sp. An116 TaxID=1965546 RepID=UPI0013A637EE|nr:GNAT family N-acetyltransferase [Alistipes sp. An116]